MKVLLDTHTLIWAVDNPAKLTGKAATILQDPNNDLFVSAATIWETSIKVALKKLTLSQPFQAWMTKAIGDLGASILPIMIVHADAQINLPQHRDPFDRLLTAQVLVEGMSLLSADAVFDQYAITRLW